MWAVSGSTKDSYNGAVLTSKTCGGLGFLGSLDTFCLLILRDILLVRLLGPKKSVRDGLLESPDMA